jgi:hypothetical protein
MDERREWHWDDATDEYGIVVDVSASMVHFWGASKNTMVPEYAYSAGGHSKTFEEFLEQGMAAPESILDEVRAFVLATKKTSSHR